MKNLVLFLFVFVLGLWVTEGQLVTERPTANEDPDSEEPVTEIPLSAEGPSNDSEPMSSRGTCRVRCMKTVTYKKSRRAWCFLFRRCTKYSIARKRIPGYCYRCCKGWTGRPGKCVDINECRKKYICGRYAKCYNTPGSYRCQCIKGYKMIGKACRDINECLKNPCPSDSKCYNYPGSYRCKCKRGFRYEKNTCVDINECKYRKICDHICINTAGSYRCSCNRGFELFMNRYCVDINECKCINGGCPFPYRCINKPGFHYCECPFGFSANGDMCNLIPGVKLNFTIKGNPKVLPRKKLPEQITLAPFEQ